MKQYLLDSNAAVDLLRNSSGPVAQKLLEVGLSACALCDLTLYELYYGAYCSEMTEKNLEGIERLKQWIEIIPSSESYIEASRQKARLRKEGNLIEDFDLLIGCTAKVTGRILVTDNVKHLGRIEGVEIENWIGRKYSHGPNRPL